MIDARSLNGSVNADLLTTVAVWSTVGRAIGGYRDRSLRPYQVEPDLMAELSPNRDRQD